MAKEAYYFSHDSNARHDPKITVMRSVYGSEGYGWFWMLVEMMRETDGYKLEMQGKYTISAYAMQLHTDSTKLEQFLHDCIHEFELFKSDGEYFWSESLLRRMEKREQVSDARRKAAEKRWGKNKSNANASNDDANAMQGKESKENKEVYIVFDYWNEKKITRHKELTQARKSKINARLQTHGLEEIKKAIDNYSVILNSELYYYTHKFKLERFMDSSVLDDFLSENNPFEKFKRNKISNLKNDEQNKAKEQFEHKLELQRRNQDRNEPGLLFSENW